MRKLHALHLIARYTKHVSVTILSLVPKQRWILLPFGAWFQNSIDFGCLVATNRIVVFAFQGLVAQVYVDLLHFWALR